MTALDYQPQLYSIYKIRVIDQHIQLSDVLLVYTHLRQTIHNPQCLNFAIRFDCMLEERLAFTQCNKI